MKDNTIDEVIANTKLIEKALVEATREAFIRHMKLGQYIVGIQDGKIVHLGPDEIARAIERIDERLKSM